MKSLSIFSYIKTIPRGKYHIEIRRYLLLLLIPVILLVALYAGVYHVISKQITNYSELMINYFYTQSNTMLHEMQMTGNTIKKNRTILAALQSAENDQKLPLIIPQEITSVIEENPYVQHAYLINETTGKIYSDQGYFNGNSLDAILTNLGISDLELATPDDSGTAHVLNENRLAPYYISTVADSDGNTLGTLIITLRMIEFLKIFYSLNSEFCAIFNDDVYISTNFNRITVDDFNWYSESDISAMVGTPVKCTYLETEDYTYIVAVAKESFYQPLKPILYAFFLYVIAVLLFGYLYFTMFPKSAIKILKSCLARSQMPIRETNPMKQFITIFAPPCRITKARRSNISNGKRNASSTSC